MPRCACVLYNGHMPHGKRDGSTIDNLLRPQVDWELVVEFRAILSLGFVNIVELNDALADID